jgi:hypothetical protein
MPYENRPVLKLLKSPVLKCVSLEYPAVLVLYRYDGEYRFSQWQKRISCTGVDIVYEHTHKNTREAPH